MQQLHSEELPDFIIKSTLGVSFIGLLILFPFFIYHLLNESYFLSLLLALVLILASINSWLGFKGKYSNKINLLGVFPSLTITSCLVIAQLGVIGSYWASLALIGFYCVLPKKQVWIINILFLLIISPVAWFSLEPSVALRFFVVLLGISLFIFSSTNEIYKQHYLLKTLSVTDSLTNLYNRSLLKSSLESAISQSKRSGTGMTLLMLDIDHFKTINDQFGHNVGDSVLKQTGIFLTQSFRASDMVFRIGGEEFLAILYGTNASNAQVFSEKLRQQFEQLPLVNNHTVTISIGVSNLQPNMDWIEWMKHGDENLYIAKSNGRNQVAMKNAISVGNQTSIL